MRGSLWQSCHTATDFLGLTPLSSPSARRLDRICKTGSHRSFDPMRAGLHRPYSQVAGEIRPDRECNYGDYSDCDSDGYVGHGHTCHLAAIPRSVGCAQRQVRADRSGISAESGRIRAALLPQAPPARAIRPACERQGRPATIARPADCRRHLWGGFLGRSRRSQILCKQSEGQNGFVSNRVGCIRGPARSNLPSGQLAAARGLGSTSPVPVRPLRGRLLRWTCDRLARGLPVDKHRREAIGSSRDRGRSTKYFPGKSAAAV